MSKTLKKLTKLTKGVHPVVGIGAAIATAALVLFIAQRYRRHRDAKIKDAAP